MERQFEQEKSKNKKRIKGNLYEKGFIKLEKLINKEKDKIL